MAKLPHGSASQIETYLDCPRKWGLDKIDKIPRRANKYAQFGTDMHAVIEEWLQTGKEIDTATQVGEVAMAGARFWPAPGTCDVEREFFVPMGGTHANGFIDVFKQYRPDVDKPTLVHDHKSTGNYTYMKTPETLSKDPQGVIYGHVAWELDQSIGISEIDLNLVWVYYHRTKKSARKVQLRVIEDGAPEPERDKGVRPEFFGVLRRSDFEEQWDRMNLTLEEMTAIRVSGVGGNTLPYNVKVCPKYGGCDYFGKACKRSGSEILGGYMANAEMADKMKKALAAKKAAAAAEQEEPKEAATEEEGGAAEKSPDVKAPSVGAKMSLAEKMKAKRDAAAAAKGGDKAPEKSADEKKATEEKKTTSTSKPNSKPKGVTKTSKTSPAINAPEGVPATLTPTAGLQRDIVLAIVTEVAKKEGSKLDDYVLAADAALAIAEKLGQ